jgi:hypothetical protein
LLVRINLLGLTRPHLESDSWFGCDRRPAHFLLLHEPRRNRHGSWRSSKGFMTNTIITFVLGLGFLLGVVVRGMASGC